MTFSIQIQLSQLSLKNAWLPSKFIFVVDLLFPRNRQPHKNTFVLVDTVLN